jgi:replicative DNA helicase
MAVTKIPPHSADAETSVLGAVMLDRDAIVEVAGFLRPEHFYNPANGLIYSAMLALFEQRQPIDLVTIKEKLKEQKKLKEAGGIEYLSDLVNKVPTAAHVEQYGRIVRDHASKRSLIKTAAEITDSAFDEARQLRDVLDSAEQKLFAISQESLAKNFIPMKDILAQSFDRLDELQKRGATGYRGLATGFRDLDNLLAGMQDSNLLVLASRPGVGKTAISLNIALHIATKEKLPVGIFSLEMSQEELGDRLLVTQADIDAWKLKTMKLDDEDFDKLQEAMGVLSEAPIFIDDTPGINIMEMRTKARRLQAEHDLKFLIVDYLQLVDCGRKFDNRVQEVSIISQSLKNIARELKIPVLALSQLSRAVEAREKKVPQLADLRESGSIEQDADVVMFLYRAEEDPAVVQSGKIPVNLQVAKHRNGALGEFNFLFTGNKLRFNLVEGKRGS